MYTIVYTRVHRGDHYYFVSGLSFTLWMGSCLLCEWVLLGSPEGLVPAGLMGTSQLYEWARANAMDSLFSSLRQAPLVIVTAPL